VPPARSLLPDSRLASRSLAQPNCQFRNGILKDISARGLCLILDCALPVGQRLVVQIPGRRRGSSLSRLAQVLRVEPNGEGRWLVGCKMNCPLSNEEIRVLGRASKAPARLP
jgi:hypothetical protein